MGHPKGILLTAWRQASRNHVSTVIAVASLAIGLAAAILALGYLRFELMYDRWVPDGERIYAYKVLAEVATAGGSRYDLTVAPTGALDLPAHIRGVEAATALGDSSLHLLKDGIIQKLRILTAQPSFFDFFPLAIRAGDPGLALSTPGTLVLTAATARRLLGPGDPLGRTVPAANGESYRVGAVVDPLPEQTHFDFDVLVGSPATFEGRREWTWEGDDRVYLKLAEGHSIDRVQRLVESFTRDRIGRPGISADPGGPPVEIRLCPLVKLHIFDDVLCTSWEKPPVDPRRLHALAAIVLGVLVLGTMNFASIALARSLSRSREAALRKVLGASRGRLIRQFLGEPLIIAAASLLVGLVLAALFGAPFAKLVGQGESHAVLDGTVVSGALLLAALAGVAGGFYPAFIAANRSAASILVGARERQGGLRLQTVLVAIQFTLAIGLATAAIVVQEQNRHILSADRGFDAKGVVVVKAGPDHADMLRAMETALRGNPAIRGVARASGGPGIAGMGFLEVSGPERAEPATLTHYRVGADFFKIYRLRLRRPPGAPPLDDIWSGASAIVNEAALRTLGFATAEDALGNWLTPSSDADLPQALQIVGVLPDVFASVKSPPRPQIFTPVREGRSVHFLAARLAPGREAQGLAAIDRVWRERAPDAPIDRYFVAQKMAGFYDQNRRTALSFGIAAGLVLALAATGLFGLAALMVERRRREIAVRKILGARLADVLGLVTWQLLRPMLPAMLLAWAIAGYFLQDWLEGFVIRIDLTPLPFALAGLGALLAGGLAVIGHALRAAALHPARTLAIE